MPDEVRFVLDASLLAYLVDSIKGLVGRDDKKQSIVRRFERLSRLGLESSANVQCVGMHEPIPIEDIYQATRLVETPFPAPSDLKASFSIFDLIENQKHGIILAGPGDGKTLLMHWLFRDLATRRHHTPVLIPLRRQGALQDLRSLVSDLW